MHPEFLDSALDLAASALKDLETDNAYGAAVTVEALREVLDENYELANKLIPLVAKQVAKAVE